MASRAQIQEQRHRVVAWAEHHPMFYNHLQNGVARGLYPQVVADLVSQYTNQILEIETDNLMDMVREEE